MIIKLLKKDAVRYDILCARYTRLERYRPTVPSYKAAHYYEILAMICEEIAMIVNPLFNSDNEIIR